MCMHACMNGITWACVLGVQTLTYTVLQSFLEKSFLTSATAGHEVQVRMAGQSKFIWIYNYLEWI